MIQQDYAKLWSQLRQIAEFPAGYARLGKGDGSGTIIADQSKRLVYVYEAGWQVPSQVPVDQNINLISLNNPALEGQRVRLAHPSYDPDRVYLMGVDTREGLDATGGITSAEQLSVASLLPAATNLMPLRLAPYAGLVVYVNPGWYYQPSTGDLKFFAGDTYDFATIVGALSSGQHQLSLVCLDAEAGTLTSIESTAETGADKDIFGPGTIDGLVVKATYQPSGGVHLYCGQATPGIVEADVYRGDADPRVLFSAAGLLRYSTANTSNPPTDAELDAAFGTPAAVGAGWSTILNDNGAGANEYLVWSDGSAWWYAAGTKAT